MIGLFQPEVASRLSGHPITDKLVMALNFSKVDPALGGIGLGQVPEDTGIAGPGGWIAATVNYVQGINRYGRWAGFGAATLNSRFLWDRSDFIPTSGGCTVLMLYEKADGTNRNSVAFSQETPDDAPGLAKRCSASVPFTTGVVFWDFGGATVGVTRVSASGLSFGADRWVFSTGDRGMEIWQNGIKRASNGANPSRTSSAATGFSLGAKGATATFSDIAHYNLFAMWARQLTQDEILMVSADPYMLWESPSVPWSLSAVTGEGEADAPSEHPYAGGLTIYKVTPERWG